MAEGDDERLDFGAAGGDAPPGATRRRLGRYQLCFELASGGMATVYLARAEGPAGFEKLVALKCIHPHLAREQEFVDMFLDEARIASRISHPNVCSVFEVGSADDTYYLAMEYVVGETLSRVLRRLARDPEGTRPSWMPVFVARIIADICEGLHAAHELRGDKGELLEVVHRDVTPQNLFVSYDGTARIVDFGIAKARGRLHHTQAGLVKGKIAYLAPEQIDHKPIDRRADVWALGVVLWEMSTGMRLFRRDSEVDTLMAVTSDPILAPSEVRPEVPKELDAIALRALSRDPAQRYATAREMGRDLHRFIAGYGEVVGAAEIAEWMEETFGEERRKRLAVIEGSRTVGDGPVLRLDDALRGPGTSARSASESLPAPRAKAAIREAQAAGALRAVRLRKLSPIEIGSLVLAGAALGAAITSGIWRVLH